MTRDREPEKREVEIESGNYREARVGDQGTYIEGNYYDMRGQVSRKRQAPPQRNKTQQALLDWVKNEVKNRLKNSLHNRVSILLEKEEDPTKVNPPWAIDVKIGTHQPFRLPSNTTITDIYDREDIKGRLLILGAPGSGKTTTLLQLAQVLINRAEKDSNQPIPVLLNLSSWRDDKQSIKNWVIADLKLKYGVRRDIAQRWLEEAAIIALLDGLDELESARQNLGVERINQFLQPSSWFNPLVVCSRSEEYQRAAMQLGLNGSTILQPLNSEQIKDYLLRTEGAKLWEIVKNDPSLMNLAQTPLLLTIMVISCEKISFDKWQKLDSSPKRLSYLFDAYIEMMLGRKYQGKQPTTDKTKQWLGCLAVQLEEQNQTEFLIETMQPYCLKTKKKRVIYELIVRLIFGLIGGVIFGLIFGLIGGVIFGLFFGLFFKLNNEIKLVETLSFSWETFRKGLNVGLKNGLNVALFDGVLFGLIYGLIYGLSGPEIDFKNYPNQGVKESVKNAVILSISLTTMLIVIGLAIQPIFDKFNLSDLNIFLFFLLGFGIIVGAIISFLPAIQHFSLHVVLWFNGYIPWNYTRFLDYATDRLFLQRVGGGYRFIHRLLQEHFAQLCVE